MTEAHSDNTTLMDKIVAIFEETRETPGAPFKAESMIHYLLENPDGKQSVHNSFKGKRYFVRFMRRVELTFGVCFSNTDLETIKGLDKLSERVAYRIVRPDASLKLVDARLEEKVNSVPIVAILLLTLPLVGLCYKLAGLTALVLLALALYVIAWIIRAEREDRHHYRELKELIVEANKASDATSEPARGADSSSHQG